MATRPQASVITSTHSAEGAVSPSASRWAADAHVVDVDTHPAFGGQGASPSPLSHLLVALSSCNQVTAALVAKELGVTTGAWTFDVQGDLDTAVMVSGADGNANVDAVTVWATVQTDADAETFARLQAETERRCPVIQAFQRSGLECSSDWTNAPLS